MVTHVVGRYWPAVVRDVLGLGYRAKDIFTELTLEEMVAIVNAAPPASAIRDALEQGWSREAHLLANLTEQGAGLVALPEPYDRPGLDGRAPVPPAAVSNGVIQAETMTWEQMDALEAERASATAAGATTVRKW